ncbi:phage integrase SAM-like domain-containing protein [Epilithonimonas hominis]|uniref:phage integrase SAM-like domain-containing protein n=1 Tax=Epilithonimonas hominis TaxID=420404 RepID=UPI002897CE89|nr:phage integrase SAM-like domain-containing protein [Epilithonimonas hominis]
MATVNFLLRSTVKKNDPFTARLQFYNPSKVTEGNKFGLDFVEYKTKIFVFDPEEVKEKPSVDGKDYWKDFKKYKGKDEGIKERIDKVYKLQEDIRNFILEKYDLSFPEGTICFPTKDWLQKTIDEYYNIQNRTEARKKQQDKPKDLIFHFNNYIKLKSLELKPRTILKLEDIKNIIIAFETFQSSIKGYDYKILIPEVDEELKFDLVTYLQNNKKYSQNTIAKIIKVIRTVCNYSTRYRIELSPTYVDFRMAYDDTDVVYLSFKELQTIINTEVPKELEDAKIWLYLSSFLGQRVSDFMRFNSSMIRKEGKDYFIDFIQVKTEKKMSLLLHPEVVKILQNNDMNFPSPISEQLYNDQIKKVCEIAGINEIIEGSILTEVSKGVWRKVSGYYPKYKLVGSHIGRKSYCTNFYGKIPTSLILEVSGHTEERTLLSYIAKKDATNSKMLGNFYDKINITED